jgi:general secretion pathway protein G
MKEQEKQALAQSVVHNVRGMTLIEIMVVITIIGIMAGAIGYAVFNYLARAKIKTTKLQLRKVAQVLINYAEDVENNEEGYPSSLDKLTEGKFPLLRKKDLKDAWAQPLIYNYPAQKNTEAQFDLCSKGPDKKEGTDDDICFKP